MVGAYMKMDYMLEEIGLHNEGAHQGHKRNNGVGMGNCHKVLHGKVGNVGTCEGPAGGVGLEYISVGKGHHNGVGPGDCTK